LYFKINNELDRIGKTKSQFLRMLINNYFNDHSLDEKNLVNRLTASVNQLLEEDLYQTTKTEVDDILKDKIKYLKK
jgi:hypothetical protein